MALNLLEGFDHYNSGGLASVKGWNTDVNNNLTQWAQSGRITGQAVKLTGGAGSAQHVRKLLTAGATEVYSGFALNPQTLTGGTGSSIVYQLLTTAGAIVAQVGINAAGTVSVLNSASSGIATGTAVISAGSWCYIELHALAAGASGSISTWVNGVADIAPTTTNIGSTAMGGVGLNSRNNTMPVTFDDIYLLDTTGSAPDNTNLGDTHVETVLGTADGTNIQWTPSSGTTHFNLVNENPPDGDLTYVSSSAVGQIDEYVFSPLSVLTGTVFAIQTNMYARKDNASTRQIKANVRSGGTDYQPGALQTLSTSYVFYSDIIPTNPGTSSPWTVSGVNNAQFGVELNA